VRLGITPFPTTVKNRQANSICERLHQSAAEVIHTVICKDPPEHRGRASQTADNTLAAAACAAQTALHSTLGLCCWTSKWLLTGKNFNRSDSMSSKEILMLPTGKE